MRERERAGSVGPVSGASASVESASAASVPVEPASAGEVAAGAGESPLPAPRSSRMRLGVGAAVVLVLGALVVAVLVSAAGQQGVTSVVAPGLSPLGASAAASATPAPGEEVLVLVHVLGAVTRPGLVSLTAGARVLDAVAAAGGLTADADLTGVNLARSVSDGEQLAVPRIGDPVAAPPPAASGGSPAQQTIVNLNTATQADLETLPRIGAALASRILDWRTANGRFAAPSDLLSVTGIGQKLFDGLKDRVTV